LHPACLTAIPSKSPHFGRLVLLGGGRTPPQAAWASLVQKQGPLTFALFAEVGRWLDFWSWFRMKQPHDAAVSTRQGDVEKLKVGLTSLIEAWSGMAGEFRGHGSYKLCSFPSCFIKLARFPGPAGPG